MVHVVLVPTVHCCNKVVLNRAMLCVCLVVILSQVSLQNTTFLATRIGRSSTSLDSARFWDNAVCVVAYKMTSTNTSGLFGRVGEFGGSTSLSRVGCKKHFHPFDVSTEHFTGNVQCLRRKDGNVFYSQHGRGKCCHQPSRSK